MRKTSALIVGLAALFVSACSDSNAPSPTAPLSAPPRFSGTLQTCADFSGIDIIAQINLVFGQGSPNANSALGKFDNIKKQLAAGNITDAEAKTWILTDFILDKQHADKLPSGQALSDLVNALFCYVGLQPGMVSGSDAWIIPQGNLPEQFTTGDGNATLIVPPNVVNENAILSITRTNVALNTKLDVYPLNYDYTLTPAQTFNSPVTAAVCAYNLPLATDPTILSRLRLGHNTANGFRIEPPVDGSDLVDCNSPPPATQTSSLLGRLGDKLLAVLGPKAAWAWDAPGASGVGGTLLEFSPIGAVDPLVKVIKVSGDNQNAPIGTAVTDPLVVRFETPNGPLVNGSRTPTVLDNIPADFTTASGSIAPASALSDLNGLVQTTAWTLGLTPGAQSATVTPKIDITTAAVPGVTFTPATVTFDATANPPTAIVIDNPVTDAWWSNALTSSYTAGSVVRPVNVRVVDANGTTVQGYTGELTASANVGPLLTTAPTYDITETAVAGKASFTKLGIGVAGSHTISIAGSFNASALTSFTTGSFTVNPGAAVRVALNDGDGQAAPAGQTLGTYGTSKPPSVKVYDSFDNLVSGTPVYFWTNGGVGSVSPNTANTAGGIASTMWTLDGGTNTMIASIDPQPSGSASLVEGRYYQFTATGIDPTGVIAGASCAPGNQKDPISSYFARITPPKVGNKVPAITRVRFYFSVNGSANVRTNYRLRVTAFFNQANVPMQVQSNTVPVALRGNNSEQLAGQFSFGTTGIRADGPIVFRVTDTENTGAVISYNMGSCSPGRTCNIKPAPCANVFEVAPFTSPVNLNTAVYRASVGIETSGYYPP